MTIGCSRPTGSSHCHPLLFLRNNNGHMTTMVDLKSNWRVQADAHVGRIATDTYLAQGSTIGNDLIIADP